MRRNDDAIVTTGEVAASRDSDTLHFVPVSQSNAAQAAATLKVEYDIHRVGRPFKVNPRAPRGSGCETVDSPGSRAFVIEPGYCVPTVIVHSETDRPAIDNPVAVVTTIGHVLDFVEGRVLPIGAGAGDRDSRTTASNLRRYGEAA